MRKMKKTLSHDTAAIGLSEEARAAFVSSRDDAPLDPMLDGIADWSEIDPPPGSPDAEEITHEEVMARIDERFGFAW